MTNPGAQLGVVLLVIAVGLVAPLAVAAEEPPDPIVDLLPVVLPVTPAEARQLFALLDAPDRVVVELSDAASQLAAPLAGLPDAFLHDLLDTPARHLTLLQALATDTVSLGRWLGGRRTPLFRDTIRALHRARTLTTAAALVDRLTAPENRTIRLAVVLTARANGVPLDTADLDLLRHAVLRPDSADLAPVVARAVTRLIQLYGRDAVRLIVSR